MDTGALDATLLYVRDRNLVDRSQVDLENHPKVKNLFTDPQAEGIRYFRKTGIFPVNHTIVIRRSVVEKHPWAAINIYKAFQEANERVEMMRKDYARYHVQTGLIDPAALDTPLCEYGITANQDILDKILSYSLKQGLTKRRLALNELFFESTLGL